MGKRKSPAKKSTPPIVEKKSGLPEVSPDFVEQDFPDEIDNTIPTRSYQEIPMVALGGSAGSLVALQAFFEKMPADTGMIFVVVVHLAPEHTSILPEILARCTSMQVQAAEDNVFVQPNNVYVIPPGKHLTVADGHLRLNKVKHEIGVRVTVDLFFRSLADTHGPNARAIVLSGADGDGALGIKRIKERGGLTIAQDPAEAEHHSMPQSAIATGMVDWVLPVGEIPRHLLDYRASEKRLRLPSEEGPQPTQASKSSASEDEAALREVLSFLRMRTGRDFSYYKRATIVRRVARRLQINGLEDLQGYLSFLRMHPGETGALLQDLLISVTNFFRDRDAFEALEQIIPTLFAGKGPNDVVRVWVPACATGEEAYSMAILLLEHARRFDTAPGLQVFGSDLDENAIQQARAGIYPSVITADVSEERLRRFFLKDSHGWRVRREVREIVLFAAHDLLKDAPFSRMDLISNRNLLIYLNHEAQKRALDLFHFALKPHGVLFLGSSESVEEGARLFEVVDKKHRIFRQYPSGRIGLPVPTAPNTLLRALEAQEQARGGPILPGRSFGHSPHQLRMEEIQRAAPGMSAAELHFRLIERYAPPSAIVNADHDLVHLSENAGRFLSHAGGEPTMNILRIVHPMLRVELRAALFQAAENSMIVEVPRVPMDVEGQLRAVTLRVMPARELALGFLLITFQLTDLPLLESGSPVPALKESEPVVRQLEREIEVIKGRLRDTVEQYEAGTEELKASNEELQAMNEELRSASEELETSREELQSINEELSTVNGELKNKLEELGQVNSDLFNLMAATAIPTIFLDRDLCIMRYTPTAVALFQFIPGDIGRPLSDLRRHIDYPDLSADALRVLEYLTPIEREAQADGRWYLARLLPYRTLDDRIAGVVLTFVDITEIRRAREAVQASEEQFRRAIEAAPIPVIMHAEDGQVLQISDTWTELTGFTREDIPTFDAWLNHAYGPGALQVRDHVHQLFEGVTHQGVTRQGDVELEVKTRTGETRHWAFSASAPGMLRDGRRFVVGMAQDITERIEAEAKLRESKEQLEAASNAKDHFLAVLSHELRTPLAPVLMAIKMLSEQGNLSVEMAEAFEMIERNVELETHMIDDLLDMTRISRGKFELEMEDCDLHEIVRRAVETVVPEFSAKRQKFTLTLEAVDDGIRGDTMRLQQALWNLLKNASKFTPEEGTIQLRTWNEGKVIRAAVSDSGIGFTAGALERIFEPFSQADRQITRTFGGLGIGLAIVKAVVKEHDGDVSAVSEGPGKGATFTVELPLRD